MSKTYKLFLISFVIVSLSMILATFSNYLNLGRLRIILPAFMTIAFGISIAGLILGVAEIRHSKAKRIIIGLSGHVLILLIFFYIVYLALAINPSE